MTATQSRDVFVTGSTGYIASQAIPALLARGHRVRAFARAGSVGKVPAGATPVPGDALDAQSVASSLRPVETVVHLVGTPHPSPSKATEFLRVDLASIRAVVEAARKIGVSHLVYVSVAHPAPVMRAYVASRTEGERAIAEARLTATVLRPWYVLGPGHRWPLVLVPVYFVASFVPSVRDGARRLGLVTQRQMVRALVRAVEDPPPAATVRVVDVPAIRRS